MTGQLSMSAFFGNLLADNFVAYMCCPDGRKGGTYMLENYRTHKNIIR